MEENKQTTLKSLETPLPPTLIGTNKNSESYLSVFFHVQWIRIDPKGQARRDIGETSRQKHR